MLIVVRPSNFFLEKASKPKRHPVQDASHVMKFYTPFTTQDPENHTLFNNTYPLKPNKGEPSSPLG